jgi:phosphotransferase system HPr (HPr) family protein
MRFERKVTIQNKTGLHARPAALFVQIANKYDSEITVEKDGESVNGKSIMGILMLAAEKGSVVIIKAYGSDARQAVEELMVLLSKNEEDQFGGAIK